jgi:ribosomal protein S19
MCSLATLLITSMIAVLSGWKHAHVFVVANLVGVGGSTFILGAVVLPLLLLRTSIFNYGFSETTYARSFIILPLLLSALVAKLVAICV